MILVAIFTAKQVHFSLEGPLVRPQESPKAFGRDKLVPNFTPPAPSETRGVRAFLCTCIHTLHVHVCKKCSPLECVYWFLPVCTFRSRRVGGCNGSLRTEALGCSIDGDGQFASDDDDTPRLRTLVQSSALFWCEALRWKSARSEASATEV